jgi:hypothetical protein
LEYSKRKEGEMGRLIDIDDLREQIGLKEEVITFKDLDKVPTAYDIDKVIEQIKKSPSDRDGLRIFDGDEPMIHKDMVIEIVRRG